MIDEKCIASYQRITKIVHEEGCKIGVQVIINNINFFFFS